jgi:hypothetical protein
MNSTVLWNFSYGPRCRQNFLIASKSAFSFLLRLLASKLSESFPNKNAFAARFMIWPRQRTLRLSGFLISGRSFLRMARIAVSLVLLLSPIKKPSFEAS